MLDLGTSAMGITNREFKKRRKELMARMEPNSIGLLSSAPECLRNNDAEYQYRQSSDFYYLTGFSEPQAIMALVPGRRQGEVILFCREKDIEKELWTGFILGPDEAINNLEIDDAYPIADVDDIILGLIEGRDRIYYSMGKDDNFDKKVMAWVKNIRNNAKVGPPPPSEFQVLDHLLHELRLIKSPAEIKLMEKAAKISAEGHKAAMRRCNPGIKEYELEA